MKQLSLVTISELSLAQKAVSDGRMTLIVRFGDTDTPPRVYVSFALILPGLVGRIVHEEEVWQPLTIE